MPNRGIASEYEHAQNEGNHDRHHRHDQTGQHIAVIQHIFADLGGSGRVKADGGDTLVIGGTLVVENSAMVIGLPLEFATVNTTGVIYQAENQRASTATDVATLVNDLNALLAKLKNAGAMEEDPAVNA